MTAPFLIRDVTPSDVEIVHQFAHELAEYDGLLHEFKASVHDISQALFGPDSNCEALLLETHGKAVGVALYFFTFSTFTGMPTLYLEDLYIQPDQRGQGFGRALLERVAAKATTRKCGRMEWAVLDWNDAAKKFYRGVGAEIEKEWRLCRLTGDALERLGSSRKA